MSFIIEIQTQPFKQHKNIGIQETSPLPSNRKIIYLRNFDSDIQESLMMFINFRELF